MDNRQEPFDTAVSYRIFGYHDRLLDRYNKRRERLAVLGAESADDINVNRGMASSR